jgi:diguanylate cyclase (GGDEF)-like protein/PAS domain S-box-containing protein
MNPPTLPEQDRDLVTAQLFRYAQDMEELMRQHSRLQQQQQMILESLGKEVNGPDLLPRLLMHASPMYWVTDVHGVITHSSSQLRWQSAHQSDTLVGRNVVQLIRGPQATLMQSIIKRMAERAFIYSALHCRLEMEGPEPSAQGTVWDALLMQMKKDGRVEVYWYLSPAVAGEDSLLQAQSAFVHAVDSEHGVMVAGPSGTISAASSGFCRMSGYAETELVGSNPRMLSSGRHDAAFYQNFWLDLLDAGRWTGTIFNRRKSGQIYLQWQTITMVENLHGQVVSYISANVDLSHDELSSKRLEALAYTDPLTGLPNRRMMVEKMEHLLAHSARESEPLTLLFIDLDRFKPINDEFGHDVGDGVLQQVATRMRNALSPEHLLARVGGDEFVAVLTGIAQREQVEALAAEVQHALKPPMFIKERKLTVGASIGCAGYPRDGESMAILLQHADCAMYNAKRFGVPFCHYEAGMDGNDKPNLGSDLWLALERNEISLVYQPQVRSDDGKTVRGCEALMRWQHPLAGEVDPTLFITLAERSGAIVALGNWAVAQACQQMRVWREQGMPELTLSLNVSLRQLRDPDFAASVRLALESNGVTPHLLEMELSETQAMAFVPSDTAYIQALRDMGVRISIDDYGISFSSLSRLNFLSISAFKINPQCVQDLAHSADARAISNCMIAIGQAMGIEVIALGVETEDQARVLAGQGCRVMQGFYASHPVSAEALFQLVTLTK